MNLIFNEEFIKQKLKTFNSPDRLSLKDDNFVKSAIIFLIIPYKEKPYDLVLIRRTNRDDDKHAGEMAFPGGIFDDKFDKSYQDTALREVEEELGIQSKNINLIGSLDDHITPKKYIITPFVGYIDEHQKMMKREEEVQEIIKIPISFFTNKKNYRERTYKLKNNIVAVGKYNFQAPNGNKYVIFGATSHIIVHFIEIVYDIRLMNQGARRLTCDDFKPRGKK